MIILRPYQRACVDAIYNHLRTSDDNPIAVIPTGGGKTPVIASICRDAVRWEQRVLVLSHVKELVQQAADHIRSIDPTMPVGVYSASLKHRDTGYMITSASIQSVYKKGFGFGRIDLVIIDECHLIPPDGDGMYQTLLADLKIANPDVRLVGMTATPYRMKSGIIAQADHLLNHVCYEVGIKELIQDGYLTNIISRGGISKYDTSGLHIRAGEFVTKEIEELVNDCSVTGNALREIVDETHDRKHVLIFCGSIKHASMVQQMLCDVHGQTCGLVTGDTPQDERDNMLGDFKNGRIKYMANVNVLTTGFDAPNIDCIVLFRPTASPGLYYQMVGRGFRVAPNKSDCLVLDYGENIVRHGPVDMLSDRIKAIEKKPGNGEAPGKECPQCRAVIAAAYSVCPSCQFEFPKPDDTTWHAPNASKHGVLSGQSHTETLPVSQVYYSRHEKRNNDPANPKPPTLRVDYRIGLSEYISEWVCIEHDGYARQRAEEWWRDMVPGTPFPESVDHALVVCEDGDALIPFSIDVKFPAGETFPRVVSRCFVGDIDIDIDDESRVGIAKVSSDEIGPEDFDDLDIPF